jgi:E3 ubiquitin-protein ligase HUWE1
LLRNLIDSPQLLSALRVVLGNAKVFGSNVWSGAVNIMSSFIHNEPTSYAVIAEAGLSRGLLEAVTMRTINVPEKPKEDEVSQLEILQRLQQMVPREPSSIRTLMHPE